jgi:misacylated tRNA(Ala) deacylase
MASKGHATGLLYATDAYQRDFEAVVTGEQRQRSAVALETTAFFPTGGGQPHDTGVLKWGSATARVVDATKGRDGVVWHTPWRARCHRSAPRLPARSIGTGGIC